MLAFWLPMIIIGALIIAYGTPTIAVIYGGILLIIAVFALFGD